MDGLRIQFGDGVSAVDRASRAIVLLTAEALKHLDELGYVRSKHTGIEVHDEGMPVWITLRGERVFVIDFEVGDEPADISVRGRWIRPPRRRSWLSRLLGR